MYVNDVGVWMDVSFLRQAGPARDMCRNSDMPIPRAKLMAFAIDNLAIHQCPGSLGRVNGESSDVRLQAQRIASP